MIVVAGILESLPPFVPWFVAGLTAVVMAGVLLRASLIRIPANRVLVLPGTDGQSPRWFHGGLVWRRPWSRRHGWLALEPYRFVLPLPEPLDEYEFRVSVAVGTDPASLRTAATVLLPLTASQIAEQAEDVVAGVVRETCRQAAPLSLDNATLQTLLADVETTLPRRLASLGLIPLTVTLPAPAAYIPTHRVIEKE